jgi:hypothetical protein
MDISLSLQRERRSTDVHQCTELLPKSGSGKVMWRLLQEAETAAR